MADPEHYRNSRKVVDTNQEYRTLKNTLKEISGEWDKLTADVERLNREMQHELDSIEVQAGE